jgi:hypothetical protein
MSNRTYSIDSDNSNISATILKAFDEHINRDKEKLAQITPMLKKREEIEKIAKELQFDIKNLAKTIQDILDKHHKDYISTFSTFMDTVRKDLKLKLEQMEKIEEEKRKINDVRLIKCERDYFRLESIRMNNLCKNLKNKIDDMSLRMKILSDEVNNVTIKWKDSENANKQLILELENNINSHKEIENELNQMKEMIVNKENENENNVTKSTNFDDEINFNEINRLKNELKREKMKNQKNLNELNRIALEKNKLENIFIDCIEETRKNIFNRRLKENLSNRMKKNFDVKTNYDSFLPNDKKAILENFVFNDEVSNLIRETIFNKPKKEKEIIERNKNIIDKINLQEFNYRNGNFKMNSIKDYKKFENFNYNHKNGNFQNENGKILYKTGKITMNNFYNKKNSFGTSSNLSIPLQIEN